MSVKWVGCLLTLLLILTGLDSARAEISNLRKCADPKCKEPISKGRTMIGYPSNDEQILSFPINAEVTVYSKEAGSRLDLWGVEIKGKRGYVPKQYIREHKVFVSKLEFEVPTEGASDNEDSAKDETESNAEPILTEILAEEIALSAEDVEYKRLQEAPLAKEESDPLEEDVQVSSESDGENENGDQGDLETKKPLHDKSAEVDVNEEEEKGNDGGDEEEEKVPDEMENQRDSTDNEKLENNDEKSKGTGSETLSPDENEGDNLEPQPSVVQEGEVDEDTKGEHTHTDHEASAKPEDPVSTTDVPVDEEVLPVDYEVIDGTTLYFDDTTPLPPTAEVVSPVNLMSSSAMDEEYVTAHPSLKLSQEAHVEGSEGQIVDISVTSTVSLEMSTATLIESGSETAATEAVLEPTEVLAFEEVGATQTEETPIPLNPTPSLLSEATASVTSWFGNEYSEIDEKEKQGEQDEVNEDSKVARNSDEEEEEEVDELENENGFGSPKAESVIDGAEIMSEEKESEGFFSSWFSSSEPPKVEEVHDESADDSGTTKSDKAIHGEVEVESEIASDGSSAEAPKADPVDYITPPETIEFPVEPTESPELNVRPPHAAAADVDIAYNTQHSPLSSVDDFPETPVTSDLDQNPETPLDPEDKVSVDDPSVDSSTTSMNDQVDRTEEAGLSNAEIGDSAITSTEIRAQADNTAVSDVEDPHTSSPGDDEDLDTDTSTARPLYAEPEPASQEYHSHSHVDHDDLSHLAGEGAVMDGSESSEGESADMSLSEGLLKTSHNLWLALTGAVQLPEGLAFGFEAEIAEPQVSNGMLVFLLIVSGTVVTIYFVHLVMMAWQALLCKISREGPLLEALNRIDHENRVKADENESLHAELVKARAELESVASRVTMSSGDVNEISSQLEMVKESLAQVTELAVATEQQLLLGEEEEELLASDDVLMPASIDHLQSMLDGQREKVETLTSDLALKNRLNEELHNELSSSMERANKLDYQVEQLTHSLEELTGVKGEAIRKLQEEAALVEELKQANTSLTQQTGDYDSKVTSLSSELTDLRETISQLRESVETKESELQVAKECLKQLRLTSSDDSAAPDEEKLSALFDVIRVKAELHKVNNDRLNLVEQLQDAEMAQKNLEEAMASIRTEVTELRTHHDVAIREKQEAMSKLEVLTKYFEEKEAQLTKELESQEGLRVNAEGSAAAVAKKIQNYELELASYKKHKKHSTFMDIKPKRQLYHLPPEVINLSDLSPTTANVPMSDEYKVEWVKARAEMKRRKSSASSTDKSDKASVSTTSNRNSAGSSYPSSESLACPSDSSTNLVDSPIRPCCRKDVKQLSDDDDAREHKLIHAHTVDVVPSTAAVLTEPVSTSKMIEVSPLRPSSLTVMTGSHPVSVVYSASRPSVFHRTVSPVERSGSLNDDLPSSISEIKEDIPVVTEERVMKRELSIPSLCLDDDVTESVKESPASDDFKSSVAAIRSFYEAKKGILLGKSKSEPGFRLRTQVETLRKELEEQEASYKSQITIHEQKAHENWLQARSAERKNEEQRQENSQLRGRLTMLQKEKEEVQQSQVNIIKPTPKRVDANGTMSSPRPMVDGVDGDHSGPPSLHRDLDSPPIPPPHPMHGPPMLPMMFPPGGPLPPGVPPPHGLPPPPPGLPHGVPPPHGLPPHPFLPGEPPFMGPLPPLHGDRRLPPAGGMSSPPFRRSGSPSYDHRNDRYSPLSDRSHISDRRHSPPPLRRRPLSPEMHRNRSPDRRSDRTRSPDRRSDRIMRSPDHRNERRSPDRRSDRRSPDRHYTRSPDGYMRHRNSPRSYYDEPDYNNDDSRLRSHHIKGKKTSTPLGPNDR
ncbi:transport and Golgi organization protein 1-like isoform X4 [Macrobrachium rosenbergii]|uniref:transport and Golgi organization protein 1-like isoform X4 n=1 Tax=Macrobrachium rosenbergii TaxID=79674 RepID=UPI0034D3A97D